MEFEYDRRYSASAVVNIVVFATMKLFVEEKKR